MLILDGLLYQLIENKQIEYRNTWAGYEVRRLGSVRGMRLTLLNMRMRKFKWLATFVMRITRIYTDYETQEKVKTELG